MALKEHYSNKQVKTNEALASSIDIGLEQSKKGKVRPHQEVMTEIRARYKIRPPADSKIDAGK